MKLLIVAPFDSKGRYKGGISSIVNTLYDSGELQKKNVIITKFDTCRIARENITEGRFNYINIRNSLEVFRELPKTINADNPDTMYFHTSVGLAFLKDCLIILYIKRLFPLIKIVLHIHFADYDKIMPRKIFTRKIIVSILRKNVDNIIFLSEKTREEFIENGIEKQKTTVVYNFSTLHYKESVLKNKTGIIKFLFVGSLTNRKGIYDIISALKRVHGDYEFHICGDFVKKGMKQEFDLSINEIKNRIFFHGFVTGTEKERIFANSDVLVLPSYGEGLPVVILEAYSAGCAVVSTYVGAIPEIVNENSGSVLEPGNIDGLCTILQKYVSNGRDFLSKQQEFNYKLSSKYTVKEFSNDVYNACFL